MSNHQQIVACVFTSGALFAYAAQSFLRDWAKRRRKNDRPLTVAALRRRMEASTSEAMQVLRDADPAKGFEGS